MIYLDKTKIIPAKKSRLHRLRKHHEKFSSCLRDAQTIAMSKDILQGSSYMAGMSSISKETRNFLRLMRKEDSRQEKSGTTLKGVVKIN